MNAVGTQTAPSGRDADRVVLARVKRARDLLAAARDLLAGMALDLELGETGTCLAKRRMAAVLFAELAGTLDMPGGPACLAHRGEDALALQAFRRQALHDVDALTGRLDGLIRGPWRTGEDERTDGLVRASARAWAAGLLAAALALGAWGLWQSHRAADLAARLDAAKIRTATGAVALIGSLAGEASANRGQPVSALVPDMAAACGGRDLRNLPADHPCRRAWAETLETLRRAVFPPPGDPMRLPTEILLDPWSSPYALLPGRDGQPPLAVSPGPDGVLGTADDIAAPVFPRSAPSGNSRERQ